MELQQQPAKGRQSEREKDSRLRGTAVNLVSVKRPKSLETLTSLSQRKSAHKRKMVLLSRKEGGPSVPPTVVNRESSGQKRTLVTLDGRILHPPQSSGQHKSKQT